MNDNKLAKNKIINIIGAAFLTFLMLGLGQISCGKIKRGIIIYFASFLLAAIAVFICTKPFPPFNILIPAIIFIGLYVFAIVDAILIARDPENTLRLKPIVGYLIQAYKIPSGAMIPTLLIGDQILVDKHIYKNKELSRGDIVIFPYPVKPEQDFIKRVVALGGDTFEIKGKQTYLNGKLLQEPYAIHKDPKIFPAEENQRDFYGPITVPTDSVFVMGDNRDNAYDSRFWGVVKKDTIKAKIINIYWSWDKEAGSVRWYRIGKQIL
ncbi:MAG: signal peptidase I [Deltaproteobacteria bacterium]|nr:signal peptidase I [Deltaproteobacteria bacterium]